MRRRNEAGVATAEVIGIGEAPTDDGDDRPLMIELVRDGEVVDHQDIHEARARHEASRAELPRSATQLSRGEPVIPTIYEEHPQ
jgi:nicotinate phosphoribosyltransferase